jgi:hypothetical protein
MRIPLGPSRLCRPCRGSRNPYSSLSSHGLRRGPNYVARPGGLPTMPKSLGSRRAGRRAELWSAAACCRFPPRELARRDFSRGNNSPPASWLEPKRQQAAALRPESSLAGISAGGTILRQQAGSNQSGSKLPHSKAQGDSLDGFFRGWRISAVADFSCMRPQLFARGVHGIRSIASRTFAVEGILKS